MTSRAFVIGAGGFLGSHLFNQLVSEHWTVFGTARQPRSAVLHAADVTDKPRLIELIKQVAPEVIFHTAAITPASAPKATLDDYLRVNVSGTLNVLEAARQSAPQARIVLVTSSAMFGYAESADGVIHETSALNPVNPYGVSKAAQHLIGYQYAIQYKMDIVRICPFNIIGYGQPLGLVASDFAHQIVAIECGEQEPVIRVGDLSAKRDFLDVQDSVRALIALASAGVSGESYNLASAQAVTVKTVLDTLVSMSDHSMQVETFPNAAKNAVPIQIGSHAKLSAATGWQPQVSLEQSLANVLTYWRTVKIEGKV